MPMVDVFQPGDMQAARQDERGLVGEELASSRWRPVSVCVIVDARRHGTAVDVLVPLTGFDDIDEQHVVIVKTLSDFQESICQERADRMEAVLEALIQYVVGHSVTEERHFMPHKFPGLRWHLEAHDRFWTLLQNARTLLQETHALPFQFPGYLLLLLQLHMSDDLAYCERIIAAQSAPA